MTTSILRLPRLAQVLGLSRSTIYAKHNPSSPYYDPDFPRPVALGVRAVGWRESDIQAWLDARKGRGVA